MNTNAWSPNLTAGETFRRRLTWRTGTPLTPVDLTGYTARIQVRDRATGEVAIELSTENGRITLDDAGHIDLYVDELDTADIPAGRYRFDLRLDNGTDVVYLLDGSSLRVREAVTA